jgi:Regulator of chromosome condensation (RCC1) repeat
MCWGRNYDGQLGDTGAGDHAAPIVVPGLANVMELDTRAFSTCARLEDGHVACWGTGARASASRGVQRVSGIDDAVEVIALIRGACVRHRGGQVACWSFDAPVAAPLAELTNPRALVGANEHVCAIDARSYVRCVAPAQTRKHLGNVAPLVADVVIAASARALAASGDLTCALLADRAVACWTLTEDDQARPVLRTVMLPVNDAVDLLGGSGGEVCVRQASGAVMCWERDGQVPLSAAGAVPLLPPTARAYLADYGAVGIGIGDSCAVRDGGVVCWGEGSLQVLGRHSPVDAQPTPHEVAGLGAVTALAVGSGECALRADGTTVCWGGPGSPWDLHAVPLPGPAASLVAYGSATCAIPAHPTAAVRAWCWGQAEWAPLIMDRHPRPAYFEQPVALHWLHDVPNARDVAGACVLRDDGQVLCRQRHPFFGGEPITPVTGISRARAITDGCALEVDGAVRCWATYEAVSASSPPPVARSMPLPPATAISGSPTHTCAVIAGGQLRCWGGNGHGQLGDGTRTDRATPVAVSALPPVAQVVVGASFSCGRSATGAVWCWGSNARGQLGDGSARDQLRPVRVPGIDDAKELRAMGNQICALRRPGTVACWGFVPGNGPADVPAAHPLPVLEAEVLPSP